MRATHATRMLIAPLMILAPALCQMGPARAAGGVLLRYHFVPGQTSRYSLILKIAEVVVAGPQQTFSFREDLTFAQKVQKVYAGGSALVTYAFDGGTVTANGKSTPLSLKSVKGSEHITPDGRVLSSASAGLSSQGTGGLNPNSGSMGSTPQLPVAPVSVGSTWTTTQTTSLGQLGAIASTQHFRLVALGAASGHTVAQMHMTGKEPLHVTLSGTKMNGTVGNSGDIRFDVDSGLLLSTHETIALKAALASANSANTQSGTISLTENLDIARIS
jgi:hypothetical protein